MKWLRRLGWSLMLLLLIVGAAATWYLRSALPQTEGTLALRGLAGSVRIERDAAGVPTIRAGSERDLAFGLGVAHAQDRLWQMETHRRIGAGRLAEVFGPGALDNDRFLRALGVRRAAAVQWQRMAAPARELLQAYTDGVNAVLTQALRARPPEFVVLGLQPEPWDPVDSLSWAIMMAWDLGGNWNTELLRLRLALQMPVERINQLLPPYPGEAPLATMDYAAFYRDLKLGSPAQKQSWQGLPEVAPPSGVEGVGSNNWVLAGSRSSSGHPLLANDPHLKLSAPSLWYLARLEAPGLKVAGATMPGLPGVVLGQNEHVAWGFTNTGPDVQDLYLEQVDAADPKRYRTPDGWAAFETTQEVIKVKGRPDLAITVRSTGHGPVISDAGNAQDVLGGGPGDKTGSPPVPYVLALRWTALDPDNDALSPAIAFNKATSVEAFVVASRGWVAPMQSMVVADRDGHIGMVAPGRVPLRRPDNDLHGLAPAPGWDARYDWMAWVPADETPRERDPERGYIATANQRITAPGYPHFITSDWAWPYRQQRIEQLLLAKPKHSLDDLAAMHADVKSLAVPDLLPYLQKASSSHALAAAALAQLQGFDGTMAADRAAPLIYWAWQRQLAQGLFADDAGAALWQRSLRNRSFTEVTTAVLTGNDVAWCDDRTTAAVETCATQVDAAFTRALDELQARFGADVSTWQWGRAHQARSEHRPFSRVKALAPWFELRTPVGGDTHTINVSRVGLRPDETTGELYLDEHGPSLRALYDLGDPSQSRVMQSTGQSGIVWSPLYRSFVAPWQRVEYLPLWGKPGDPSQPSRVLVLQPAP
jgi:penicillin amidase